MLVTAVITPACNAAASPAFAAYQTQIANEPSAGEGADAPPRPRKPANRGPNTTLRARMDQQRIAHARYEQQSNLIRWGLQEVYWSGGGHGFIVQEKGRVGLCIIMSCVMNER
jgi:hypothetical protein